jgi:hypothetical protein
VSDLLPEIVRAWKWHTGLEEEVEPCLRVRIEHAPVFRGGRLPYEDERHVYDWWPVEQIEQRRTQLREQGPFLLWEPTKRGPLNTAEALCEARGDERIAVWVLGMMWDARKCEWKAPLQREVRDVWNAVYMAVRESAQVGWHHNSMAFPYPRGSLSHDVSEWLDGEFSTPREDKEVLRRIVGYAALQRAILLTGWTLVDVAAVRGGVSAVEET